MQLTEVESSLSEVPFVLTSGFSREQAFGRHHWPPPCSSSSLRLWEFPEVRIREEESSGRGSVFRANRVWRVSSFGRSLVPASAPSLLRWLPLQQVDTDVATCQAFLNHLRAGELLRGRKESGTGSSSVCPLGSAPSSLLPLEPGGKLVGTCTDWNGR